MQLSFNVVFEQTATNEKCKKEQISRAINSILIQQDHSYRMQLSPLSPKPKELLLAIAKEGHAEHITSGNFVRKHHLTSSSSVQSAIRQLTEEGWITYSANNRNRTYQIADSFLRLWILNTYGEGFSLP